MTLYPCAKINLGLNIVARRPDGYHNLETVFMAVPLCDRLALVQSNEKAESTGCSLTIEGAPIDCQPEENLVVKAYNKVAERYPLPPVKAVLTKRIPSQAGLGGGSSDAAYMIRLLNNHFSLGMTTQEMQQIAATLGADCAFFIQPEPSFATGIGEVLTPLPSLSDALKGKYIAIVKPPVAVSTREAFSRITPQRPPVCCREAVGRPISEWKEVLKNDFETSVFALYPQLSRIKEQLYSLGALYAQMSGSGSSLFGIFENEPPHLPETFANCFTFSSILNPVS